MISLLAAGHLYLVFNKLLFLLPAGEAACSLASLRYGPASGKWERGVNLPRSSCEFRQVVQPGALLPVWTEQGPGSDALEVNYQVEQDGKPQRVTLKAEPLEPNAEARLAAVAKKEMVTSRGQQAKGVRAEVKNEGPGAVLLGDVVVARHQPQDECLGGGPTAALQPGETLVDVRPGLLSASMKVWVARFAGEKSCKWIAVPRR